MIFSVANALARRSNIAGATFTANIGNQKMTLIEHLESCGVDLKRQGKPGEYLALCPGCGKFKLAINVDKQKWQCWRCSQGGGIKALCRFLSIKEFSDGTQDIRKLRQYYTAPKTQDSIRILNTGELPKEFTKIGTKIGSFMEKRATSFLYNRGVTDRQIQDWNLGYCISGPYSGFLIIPVVDLEGKVRTWQGRRIFGGGDKNANPSNVDKIPFNLQYAKDYPGIIIVEGPFDAMATHSRLSQTMNLSSIALMGHTCSPLLARQIINYVRPKWMWIALDPDVSRGECERMAGLFKNEGLETVKICFLTKDPDEVVNIEEWRTILAQSEETVIRRVNR